MKSSGTVVCGHCTCMAGQGETCSHVGAVLYWLETRVRIREQTTCTSMENQWMVPTAMKDIPYLMLDEIDFTTAKKKMKCECTSPKLLPSTSYLKPPTEEELSDFFTEVAKEATCKPVILSLIAPHSSHFTQSSDHLPLPLQTIFNTQHLELDYMQLLELAEQ